MGSPIVQHTLACTHSFPDGRDASLLPCSCILLGEEYLSCPFPGWGLCGRLQSMGSLRVRHDWATSLSLFTFIKAQCQQFGRKPACHRPLCSRRRGTHRADGRRPGPGQSGCLHQEAAKCEPWRSAGWEQGRRQSPGRCRESRPTLTPTESMRQRGRHPDLIPFSASGQLTV